MLTKIAKYCIGRTLDGQYQEGRNSEGWAYATGFDTLNYIRSITESDARKAGVFNINLGQVIRISP